MSSPVEAKLSPSSDAKSLEAIMLCPNKPPSILCLRTESLIFRVIICGLGLYVIQPMEIYKELDVDGSKIYQSQHEETGGYTSESYDGPNMLWR